MIRYGDKNIFNWNIFSWYRAINMEKKSKRKNVFYNIFISKISNYIRTTWRINIKKFLLKSREKNVLCQNYMIEGCNLKYT